MRTHRLQTLHDLEHAQDARAKIETMYWIGISVDEIGSKLSTEDRRLFRQIKENLAIIRTHLDDDLNNMASEIAEDCRQCGCTVKQYDLPNYDQKNDIRRKGAKE